MQRKGPRFTGVSYRTKRRAFLAGLGGAFGLEALLGNLEASAEGGEPPARLLVMHWPVGTLRQRFVPAGSGRDFVASPLLAPFEAAGLREDLIALYGLTHDGLSAPGGGGNEAGTVFAVTGASSPGTRDNGGEADDAVAGGPSFDQILLKHVPRLRRPGRGYVSASAEARVWSNETSTRCPGITCAAKEVGWLPDAGVPSRALSEDRLDRDREGREQRAHQSAGRPLVAEAQALLASAA
jgi:hypothetical protein